jgi:energy-converting hydrogenase Eha subunit F
VKPYQSSYYDYVETFNEIVVLATGYFGTQLVMSGRSVEMLQQIGYALAGIITIFLTVSIIILAILMFKNIKTMILKRWS